MFEWQTITPMKLYILVFVCILLYVYNFHVSKMYPFTELSRICFTHCHTDRCLKVNKSLRGKSYYLTPGSAPNTCAFTIWEFSHIVFHMFIGYFYNLPISLLIGIPYELMEYYAFDCANPAELGYNLLGALIGNYLKTYVLI